MKKLYNQPEVQVAHLLMESMILAGSAASGAGQINTGIETNEQW